MEPLRRIASWIVDRAGLSPLQGPLKHPVPPETASNTRGWFYVFGVGIVFAFILQVVTGIMLATMYVPAPAHAYESLLFITNQVVLGRVLRGMHYFGASAMVLLVALHMARVFLTGSYKFPRAVNWLTGVLLFLLTMAMAFTGQLLRWDQNGYWTVVVGAYFAGSVPLVGDWLAQFMLAGESVGGSTLTRFFAFHVLLMPALIAGLIGIHLYLVLHHGISELPRPGQPVDPKTYRDWYRKLVERRGVPYFPDSAWQEVVFGAVVIAAIVVLAVVFGPRELSGPPDPTNLMAEPKPDWFLLWYYTLITIHPPELETFMLVYLPILVVLALLLLPFVASRGERSLQRRPWAIAIVGITAIGLITLIAIGLRAPWVPNYNAEPLTAEVLGVSSGPAFQGAQVFFAKDCHLCHTVLGRGGEYGPDLTNVAKRLSPEEITVRIVKGFGNMPAYRDNLTVGELNDIVAFLAFLSGDTHGATGGERPVPVR